MSNARKTELQIVNGVAGVNPPAIYYLKDKLPFGKYKGKSIKFLANNNPDYICWLMEKYLPFIPSKEVLKKLNLDQSYYVKTLTNMNVENLLLNKQFENHPYSTGKSTELLLNAVNDIRLEIDATKKSMYAGTSEKVSV